MSSAHLEAEVEPGAEAHGGAAEVEGVATAVAEGRVEGERRDEDARGQRGGARRHGRDERVQRGREAQEEAGVAEARAVVARPALAVARVKLEADGAEARAVRHERVRRRRPRLGGGALARVPGGERGAVGGEERHAHAVRVRAVGRRAAHRHVRQQWRRGGEQRGGPRGGDVDGLRGDAPLVRSDEAQRVGRHPLARLLLPGAGAAPARRLRRPHAL